MRQIMGKCARGHVVELTIDDDGNVRGTIGTQGVDPLPDPDWSGENPIIVACESCVSEMERLARDAGALPHQKAG